MSFSVFSYACAALAFGLLTAVLLLSRESARQGRAVLFAVGGTFLWAVAITASLVYGGARQAELAQGADAFRIALWIFCLLPAVGGDYQWRSFKGVVAVVTLVVAGFIVLATLGGRPSEQTNLALLALAILGCLTVEQIFRSATEEQKRVIGKFIWTIAALLIYDLAVSADAVLFESADPRLWAPRGLLAAIAVPFFLLAAKRHPDWQETLFVSREFVFYSATLTGVGVYLIAVAVGGLVIRNQAGAWVAVLHAAYLVAAISLLASILSSKRLKAKLRVFISKHFFRNRYDYRDEWLRLIKTLSDADLVLPVEHRSIKALAAIVESGGGQLWLDREGRRRYEPYAAWQASFPTREYGKDSALVRFLRGQQWVVDTREYQRDPEHYQHAFRDDPAELPPDSLIVPLFHQHELLGFVRIECVSELRELNYEDHDLLKTAGRQVAAFLAHDLARERLAETRQFEAYNRLSAFVMHDLKNLLAQQALLVSNAKKFRDRPEFVDDVIRTVDSGVQRMRRLLVQLQQQTPAGHVQRVELNKIIWRAVSACSDVSKTPCSFTDRAPIWVRADAEQLTSVISHVIHNAQEATQSDGVVNVSLHEQADGKARIEVRDSGVGMTEEFVRRTLFKPFETTKGTAGMGIGAFQARELIRNLGGELTVKSELEKGTVVTIVLPQERSLAEGAGAAVGAD